MEKNEEKDLCFGYKKAPFPPSSRTQFPSHSPTPQTNPKNKALNFSTQAYNLCQSATMVNFSPLVLAVAVLATAVSACDTACSVASDTTGTCLYACFDRCNMASSHHQSKFLAGLSSAGYDCKPNGPSGVSCKKTSAFGKCGSHYWECGKC